MKLEQSNTGEFECPNCKTRYDIIETELDINIKSETPFIYQLKFCDNCDLALEIERLVTIHYDLTHFSDNFIFKGI